MARLSKSQKYELAKIALAKLQESATVFKAAINEFGKAYDTHAVSLNGWKDDLSDVMFELDQDIEGKLGNDN